MYCSNGKNRINLSSVSYTIARHENFSTFINYKVMIDDKDEKPGHKPDEAYKNSEGLQHNDLTENDVPVDPSFVEKIGQEETPLPEDTPENANTEGIP